MFVCGFVPSWEADREGFGELTGPADSSSGRAQVGRGLPEDADVASGGTQPEAVLGPA